MNSPERTCAVCRKKAEKGAFIRIVKEINGQVSIDNTQKKDGRGMYICNNKECIFKAIKSKAVSIKYVDGVEAPFITAKGIGKKAEKICQSRKRYCDNSVVFIRCSGWFVRSYSADL